MNGELPTSPKSVNSRIKNSSHWNILFHQSDITGPQHSIDINALNSRNHRKLLLDQRPYGVFFSNISRTPVSNLNSVHESTLYKSTGSIKDSLIKDETNVYCKAKTFFLQRFKVLKYVEKHFFFGTYVHCGSSG